MRNVKRWIVPGAVGVLIAGAATVPRAFASGPAPDLPTVSAADLIASVRTTSVTALSGTVRIDAALGLPTLPDRLVGASSGVGALLTGSHNLRVWVDGADRQRLAVLDDLAETDLIHNGSDLWTYDSSTNSVTHRVLPQHQEATADPDAAPEDPVTGDPTAAPTSGRLTPQAAAQRLLDHLDPTTAVAVTGTERVAGRPVYRLTLTPRTPDTLIRSVRIDVDADKRLPLRVQIFGAAATPAWSTGFSSVSFATPAAEQFRFAAPAGATVSGPVQSAGPDARGERGGGGGPRPHAVGSGWAGVLELPAGDLDVGGSTDPGSRHTSVLGWVERSATPVPEGRLVRTSLISLLLTRDGRVFVGAVPPAVVRAAATAAGAPSAPSGQQQE